MIGLRAVIKALTWRWRVRRIEPPPTESWLTRQLMPLFERDGSSSAWDCREAKDYPADR